MSNFELPYDPANPQDSFLTYPGMASTVEKMMDAMPVNGVTENALLRYLFKVHSGLPVTVLPEDYESDYDQAYLRAEEFAHQLRAIRSLPEWKS